MELEFDIVIVGAGSAGCAVAGSLAQRGLERICVLEAGPTDRVPQVRIPFGLLFTMGSSRDWQFKSVPQAGGGGQEVKVPRGRMLGGSGSINSMVWFRGRKDDFAAWNLSGWGESEVDKAFEDVEAAIRPQTLPDPHPLSLAFGRSLGSNTDSPPTPERESAGVFSVNMRNGRRWSAADAFLRPAQRQGRVTVMTGADVDHLMLDNGRAAGAVLVDGRTIQARGGVVLSAGSIGSPAILLRSGVGPGSDLSALGIDVLHDLPGVGENLHDHPAVGLHFAGRGSGYGLSWSQLPAWALSPVHWMLARKGRLTSNFVEAGAFLAPEPGGIPAFQVHFIPYHMGHKGNAIAWGEGYFADVNLCRPRSRGRLTLASPDARVPPQIDLGLFADPADLDQLVVGVKRLRGVLERAPFAERRATEVHPGEAVQTTEAIKEFIRTGAGTSYHPVGSLTMGDDMPAPVAPDLSLRGIGGLWVADASVMPSITSANTNAPSMMIGWKAGEFVAANLKGLQ